MICNYVQEDGTIPVNYSQPRRHLFSLVAFQSVQLICNSFFILLVLQNFPTYAWRWWCHTQTFPRKHFTYACLAHIKIYLLSQTDNNNNMQMSDNSKFIDKLYAILFWFMANVFKNCFYLYSMSEQAGSALSLQKRNYFEK